MVSAASLMLVAVLSATELVPNGGFEEGLAGWSRR